MFTKHQRRKLRSRLQKKREFARKNKQLAKHSASVIAGIRSSQTTRTERVTNIVLQFFGMVTVLSAFNDPRNYFVTAFPEFLPWIKNISLNLRFEIFDSALVFYVDKVRPLIETSLYVVTKHLTSAPPPWIYDYILLNSILLSRPLSILFKELAVDALMEFDSKSQKFVVGKRKNNQYRFYRFFSIIATLPPVFYVVSVLYLLINIVICYLLLHLVYLIAGAWSMFMTSVFVEHSIISILVVIPLMCFVCIVYLAIFEDFIASIGFIGLLAYSLVRLLAVLVGLVLLAVSPYFAPIVAVYSILLYRYLANFPNYETSVRIALAPWVHFLVILIGAAILLLIFGSTGSPYTSSSK